MHAVRRLLPLFRSRALSVAVVVGASVLIAGCSLFPEPTSDPTRYYVLGGPVEPAGEAAPKLAGGLVVGMRAVQVPAYLGGKAMIVRAKDNEIDYRDFSRWAEPLDQAIGARLAERLARAPGVARVLAYPFPLEVARDVDVSVRVLRCEGVRAGDDLAAVSFEVQITSSGGGDLILSKVLTAPAGEWDGHDYGELAGRLGEAVNGLGDQLAALLPTPAK